MLLFEDRGCAPKRRAADNLILDGGASKPSQVCADHMSPCVPVGRFMRPCARASVIERLDFVGNRAVGGGPNPLSSRRFVRMLSCPTYAIWVSIPPARHVAAGRCRFQDAGEPRGRTPRTQAGTSADCPRAPKLSGT